jgi:hypothetical protein
MLRKLLAILLAAGCLAAEASYPAPKFPGDTNAFGVGLQRAMTLLATSTPERRHTVKVLFYGQSITEQAWWQVVADDLRWRFPHANLVIENRAIGGFASQLLVKTAEADLYVFQPDLLIFHVYGSHLEYENIIRRVRERTVADILMQTDHLTQDSQIAEETDPAKLTPANWNAWMNHAFLPGTAAKHGAELCDQHGVWKQYLRDTGLPAAKLLKDGVHLNQHGEWLMAECVQPHLVWRGPQPGYDPLNEPRVRTLAVGRDLVWRDGRLSLEFEGSRVDAVVKPGAAPPAAVRIDGRRPSEFPELYSATRTTPWPGSKWPCLLRVAWQSTPMVEEWTLKLRRASEDLKQFEFELAGSVSGNQGVVRNGERFVAPSGRVVIDPADWNFEYARQVFKGTLPAGFEIKWRVLPQFVDEFTSPGIADPAIETTVTLAQGLPSGRHRLEITGRPETPIAALRVYRPPGWGRAALQ